MKAKYTGKEQSWIEEYTLYTFIIDGDYYAVKETGGHTSYVDVLGQDLDNDTARKLKPWLVVTETMRLED